MIERCASSENLTSLSESVLIVLDMFFDQMKSNYDYFVSFLEFIFKLCDWGVTSEEVFIYSNVLRLLIFHV